MQRLLCVILGFVEILTGFLSNLYKADTYLQRTQSIGPIDVPKESFSRSIDLVGIEEK